MTTQENLPTSSGTTAPLKSPIDQFLEAMARRGIEPPAQIEPDGVRHYFRSNSDQENRSGWYEYHDGEIAFGSFGNIRTGLRQDGWIADIGRPLSQDERSSIAKKRQDSQTDQKHRREQLQTDAKRVAAKIMEASVPAKDSHPYLVAKNIKANGVACWEDAIASVEYNSRTQKPFLRIVAKSGQAYVVFSIESEFSSEDEICQNWQNFLIVSMRDGDGELQSVQMIAENGDKRSLYGGRMMGSYHLLGEMGEPGLVMIAKTFTNAATIHEITGQPVAIAFEAENLPTVAKLIRTQRPDAAIFLCADDDFNRRDNPGLTKAAQAVQTAAGTLIAPEFGPDRPDTATGFNEMVGLRGKEAVTALFAKHSLIKESKADQGVKQAIAEEAPVRKEPSSEAAPAEQPAAPPRKKKKTTSWGFMSPAGNAA